MRFPHIALALLSTALPCFVAAHAADTTLPPMSSAKLLTCEGTPCVDVTISNGKHLRLAIDTGNPTSFLDAKVAESLGLSLAPLQSINGKSNPHRSQTTLSGVRVGNADLGNVTFAVGDLSGQIAQGTFPKVDGTLAYSAFKDRFLQLDYPDNLINISQPLTGPIACSPANCGALSLVTFGHNGPPVLATTGFNVNGASIFAQVDTMYTGTLLVYPNAVDSFGLKKASKSQQTKHFAFTDGGVDMFEAKVHREGFQRQTLATDTPIYFAGPKVHLPDGMFEATVGSALLAGQKVNFDFHDNHFWLN